MRMPLNTRDGNADEPIEPVIWNIEPCEAAPPANLWRFTTPANPRPLLVADDVDELRRRRTCRPGPCRRPWRHPAVHPCVDHDRPLRAGSASAADCSSRSVPSSAWSAATPSRTRPDRSARHRSRPSRRVLRCVTTHGPACSTVTGRTSPLSSNSCVIPTFLPKIPLTAMFFL